MRFAPASGCFRRFAENARSGSAFPRGRAAHIRPRFIPPPSDSTLTCAGVRPRCIPRKRNIQLFFLWLERRWMRMGAWLMPKSLRKARSR